jgi:urease accessory protein
VTAPDSNAVSHAAGWQAELRLRFGVRAGFPGTVLLERRHRGPLVVQRPFHPEGDPCHVYVVHPPGGVVGGDELALHARVDAGAHALITTPAATKFYRCDGRRSSQVQELHACDATLEWLPQENIYYRGADVRTATRVRLDGRARFIGWEIACLGLPARGEKFDAGRLALDLELWRDRPLFIDRLRLAGEGAARDAAWGLAGQEAVGTLLATPASAADLDAVRALLEGWTFAAVSLVDGVLVLRALAPQAAPIRELFVAAWRVLRPAIIGRPAHAPRIWNT